MKRSLSRKNLWEAMPSAGKSILGTVLRVIPPRFLLGGAFRRNLLLVGDADRWSAERARDYQIAQLRRVVRLAYTQSPFYRKTFDESGASIEDLRTVDDISMLPTIDKKTVKENLDAMLTVPAASPEVDCVTTGGTGGEPLRFYSDAGRSAMEFAHLLVGWRRAGYTLGMPLAVFRGRTVTGRHGAMRTESDPILKHHYYSNFHMGEDDIGRYLAHIKTLGACFLHVYPSSAAALARYCRRSGTVPPSNIQGIIAESEIIYPEQRRLIEDTFGCRMFSCYGQTEKVVAAAECEHTRDYHVWPTYGVFELLDAEGKAVTTPGERGEIVGTGFASAVVPFIRYRTGDFATYVGARCEKCGREQTIVKDVEGHRTQEMLIAADRSGISITAINMHDDTFDGVRQYQFFQDRPGKAVLRVVPAGEMTARDRERILRNLAKKLEGRIDVTIEQVASIPLTMAGKTTYLDQKIPGAHGPASSDRERHS